MPLGAQVPVAVVMRRSNLRFCICTSHQYTPSRPTCRHKRHKYWNIRTELSHLHQQVLTRLRFPRGLPSPSVLDCQVKNVDATHVNIRSSPLIPPRDSPPSDAAN